MRAIPEAYDRMIAAALERKVDFVVIAGDVFDLAHPSYGDYLHFLDGLQRLDEAGIPVYLCTGNHDPYTTWRHDYGNLPANAHMLPADEPGFELYRRSGKPMALIGGRGYFNQTWSAKEDIAAGITRRAAEKALGVSAPFAVGITHTGLDLDTTKAPTKPSGLLKSGMDYWALGHIHMPWVDSRGDPHIVFSGCLQGRAIKETGPRGVYQVTLTENLPNRIEFIPTASVVWQRIRFDVSSCESLADIVDALMRELFRLNGEAQCNEMIERITLAGVTALHATLQRPGVLEDLRTRLNDAYELFFCDALIDATQAPLDKQKLASEGLFPAVFMDTCARHAVDAEDEIAYLEKAFLDKGIDMPRSIERKLGRLDAEAEDLVLDLLGGDER